jgi:hypothetical protein
MILTNEKQCFTLINSMSNMPRVFQADVCGELKEIALGVDDPVLSPYPFIYFTCDRDPTPSESTYSGYPGLIYFWYNTTSTNLFCCTDCSTAGALAWQEIVMPQNILGVLNNAGWDINTARSYVQRSSPAFSTSYAPSVTNDTQVVVILSLTSTILTASQVNIQIDSGSGFVTTAEESLSGLEALSTRSVTFTVPADANYQLVNSSGTASIIQIMELTQ